MILLIDTQRVSSPLDKAVAGFVRNLYGSISIASSSAQGSRLHLGLVKPPTSNRRSQVSASLDLCLTIPACCSSSCRAECSGDGPTCQLAGDNAARAVSAIRAVYSLRSSNPRATTKTFIYQCPECNADSTALPSLQAALQYAEQHTAAGCSQCSSQPAAGPSLQMQLLSDSTGTLVGEEEVEVQLLARVLALAALHIANLTQQTKDKHVLPAAADAAAVVPGPGMPVAAQLKPWRGWAISCLSENEELLAAVTAWLRPSWHSIHLHSRSGSKDSIIKSSSSDDGCNSSSSRGVASLLDAILAPPYVAVLDQAVGTVLEKLAVLLRRYKCDKALQAAAQQQQQQHDSADDDGNSALKLLSDVLSRESGFGDVQQLPAGQPDTAAAAEQRVSALLSQAGISSIDKVQAAMTDYPWVTDTHVQVCAFCGLSTGGLRSFKKFSTYLRPCSYCVVCVCATCIAGSNGLDVEAIAEKEGPAAAAAAAVKAAVLTPWPSKLCPWCQDHPDAQGYVSSVSPCDWQHGPATPTMLAAAAVGVPLTLAQQQLLLTWQGEDAWRLLPLPTAQLPPGYIELQLQSGSNGSTAGDTLLLLGDKAASLFVAPDGAVLHHVRRAWELADKVALEQEKKHAAREKANRLQQPYQRQFDGYPPQQQRRRRSSAPEGTTPPHGLAVQQTVADGAEQAAGPSSAERTAARGSRISVTVAAKALQMEGDAGLALQQDQCQQQQQQQLVYAPAITVQRHRAHKRPLGSATTLKDKDQQLDKQATLEVFTASAPQQQQQQSHVSAQLPEEEHNLHLQELQKLQNELQQLQQGIFGAAAAAGGSQQQTQGAGSGAMGSTRAAAAWPVKPEPAVVWLVDEPCTGEQHPAMPREKPAAELRTSQVLNTEQKQLEQEGVVLPARKRSRHAQQQPSSTDDVLQPAARPGSGKRRKGPSAGAGDDDQQWQQQAAASAEEDSPAVAATAVDDSDAVVRDKVDSANTSLEKLLRRLQGSQAHAPAACAAVQQLLGDIVCRQQWLISSCQHSAEGTLLGLQVLQQVLEALSYLPAGSSSRGGLAQCLLQPLAREFGPKQNTTDKLSVLDLLLFCWRAEVRQTGCAFEDAPRAAGMPVEVLNRSTSSTNTKVQVLLAGMSQLVYAIMVECYCPAAPATQSGGDDVVVMDELKLQVAATLLQGTALLLIHWPKPAAAVAGRVQHAMEWRQQLADLAGACHVAERLSSMLSQLKQQVYSMKAICGL